VKRQQRKRSSKKKELGKYKSSLELDCAKLLSDAGLDFFYEEIEYVLQDSFQYNAPYYKMTPKGAAMINKTSSRVLPIKYTPDFVAKDGSWIIETKGYIRDHHDFTMRWKLFLSHLVKTHKKLPALFICKNKKQVDQAIMVIKSIVQ
jgi:hypothetical protein